jgi:radical SAM protein with 4Fe4S-binding SPASM domain
MNHKELGGDVSQPLPHTLRLVAWEVTRRCNLACGHCRASALCGPYPGELGTERSLRLLDQIAAVAKPVIILTGGEPLLRPDIFEIAAYGDGLGMRMVLATNGTFVDEAVARRLIASGIKRASVSLDGPDAPSHDAFRGVPGAFAGAMAGIEAMKKAGLEFQINTTITQANLARIREIHALAHGLGAAAHHIFLLVPTGRGRDLADQAISPLAYEETLKWFYEEGLGCTIQLKATCAPHYYRIFHQRAGERRSRAEGIAGQGGGGQAMTAGRQAGAEGGAMGTELRVSVPVSRSEAAEEVAAMRRPGPEGAIGSGQPPGSAGGHPLHTMTRGCLGGISFCFISHTGQVQPCGYLELDCGQVTRQGFAEIWNGSRVFTDLRDLGRYQGKCGRCEFIKVCGGCRARAFEATGDYLAEEPLCIYQPRREGGRHGG